MNRIAIIASMILLPYVTSEAQQVVQGDFYSIRNCRAATIRYDFSKAMVGEGSFDDYMQFMVLKEGDKYIDEFKKDMTGVVCDFLEEYNDTECPLYLTVSEKPDVEMLISFRRISKEGNDITADYIFTEKATGDVLLSITMRTKEGRFGSFTNLMGDSLQEAGNKLGKYIKKKLKAIKKIL